MRIVVDAMGSDNCPQPDVEGSVQAARATRDTIILVGDKVAIEFKNSDGNHDFTIDEFNVKTKTISSGETAKVEFTASKTGSFEFYCSIGNHRQMGMKGTLLVVE